MVSVLHQDPDSTTDPRVSPDPLVRHGYCACQRRRAVQIAMCGYKRPVSEDFSDADTIPPDNACVVCLDLMSAPRPCCGGLFRG